ncbi:MAG: LamG domain-containing protein, partial [Lentisphaerae bacterium]|nr:LamG domain-containing protein [Lentisphaerota bacterium]
MKFILTIASTLIAGILCATEIPLETLILHGKAGISEGVLHLDGVNSYAQLPGTEAFNIDKNGLSLACSVRLRKNLTDRKTADSFDMFFSKGELPFIFGRYGGSLYTNIRDSGKKNEFAASALTGRIPEAGVWTHVAVTFEHYDDHAQGDVGYHTTVFFNGDPVVRTKHRGLLPVTNQELLEIGKGWGGVWYLEGEIAEVHAARRVMNEAEIAALVDSSRFVKVVSTKKVNPALSKYKALSPAAHWALASLNQVPAERGTQIAEELSEAFTMKEDTEFIKAFGADRLGVVLIARKELLLLVDSKADAGLPLLGIYDRIAKRGVLEDKLYSWTAKGLLDKKKLTIDSSEVRCTAVDFTEGGFTVTWETSSPVNLKAQSVFTIADTKVSADLKIDNRSPDFTLLNVVFPQTRTAKAGDDDALFFPYQCGVLVQNPTLNTFKYGQIGRYPGSTMTMQFSAYYGNGRGVFLGWEDPDGTAKNFQAVGKRGGVEFTWEQDVPIPLDSPDGGNDYASPGKVSFEVYSGEWFEACMIHKKWALSKATWRINELPRRDTPEWFRNMTVSLEITSTNQELARLRYHQLMFLRRYIDLPLYGSWFLWYDIGKGSWPVFIPLPFTLDICKDIHNGGCYVEPYIDSRLWDILDGPHRKSDWRWSTHGKKFAVKLSDGSIPMEHYTATTYAVMCPG